MLARPHSARNPHRAKRRARAQLLRPENGRSKWTGPRTGGWALVFMPRSNAAGAALDLRAGGRSFKSAKGRASRTRVDGSGAAIYKPSARNFSSRSTSERSCHSARSCHPSGLAAGSFSAAALGWEFAGCDRGCSVGCVCQRLRCRHACCTCLGASLLGAAPASTRPPEKRTGAHHESK